MIRTGGRNFSDIRTRIPLAPAALWILAATLAVRQAAHAQPASGAATRRSGDLAGHRRCAAPARLAVRRGRTRQALLRHAVRRPGAASPDQRRRADARRGLDHRHAADRGGGRRPGGPEHHRHLRPPGPPAGRAGADLADGRVAAGPRQSQPRPAQPASGPARAARVPGPRPRQRRGSGRGCRHGVAAGHGAVRAFPVVHRAPQRGTGLGGDVRRRDRAGLGRHAAGLVQVLGAPRRGCGAGRRTGRAVEPVAARAAAAARPGRARRVRRAGGARGAAGLVRPAPRGGVRAGRPDRARRRADRLHRGRGVAGVLAAPAAVDPARGRRAPGQEPRRPPRVAADSGRRDDLPQRAATARQPVGGPHGRRQRAAAARGAGRGRDAVPEARRRTGRRRPRSWPHRAAPPAAASRCCPTRCGCCRAPTSYSN